MKGLLLFWWAYLYVWLQFSLLFFSISFILQTFCFDCSITWAFTFRACLFGVLYGSWTFVVVFFLRLCKNLLNCFHCLWFVSLQYISYKFILFIGFKFYSVPELPECFLLRFFFGGGWYLKFLLTERPNFSTLVSISDTVPWPSILVMLSCDFLNSFQVLLNFFFVFF